MRTGDVMAMWKRASVSLLMLICTACSQSQPPVTGGTPATASPLVLSAPSAEKKAAAPIPDVGRIETVPVRADGRGSFPAEAVDEAIKDAIMQVNGKAIDLSSEQFCASVAASCLSE